MIIEKPHIFIPHPASPGICSECGNDKRNPIHIRQDTWSTLFSKEIKYEAKKSDEREQDWLKYWKE